MSTFKVGDAIQQKHQRGAPVRLVVALTDDPDVVVVHDPETGYRKILAWGHELVARGTKDSIEEAARRLASEEYVSTTLKEQW